MLLWPLKVKLLRRALLALLALVVALNWTYGRLPAEGRPTGSFVQIGSLRVHYIEHQGAEPAVVLIHGLPGTAEDFNKVTAMLPGRRTVAFDRPGYGFSTGGYVPFARQLSTLQGLLEKLHLERPILVGHSYGGTIALGFAERHPSEVRGLVLVDAAATCTSNGLYAQAQARLVQVLEIPVVSKIANATFSQLLLTVVSKQADSVAFDPASVDPGHEHRVLAFNMKPGDLKAFAGETLALNGVVSGVDRGLTGIDEPAIVIQGDKDRLVKPECGRRLAAQLPDARLVMISGGHMAPYTHPGVVAAAVRSLVGSS